ncbi:GFA family protein [Bradyrhizobium sp. CB1650]|uniref:GFA family protein n=1 Tax=Bradyrhizobium sp. CB1650 TaxID=3039153 RepID=UPI0024354F0C|nr:GFA family protein [Bradyrhizobium sp. CB1650]WGD56270.1 GFA family protein [Bradyrhizobium sp. CB1650]
MQIDGQCHCGRITYEAEIDPEAVSVCHCRDCQTLSGSPFRVTAICSGQAIRLTGGTPRVYGKRGDNGQMRFQHFCGDCGSPLFTSGEGDQSDDWGIRWGSIRQRDALRPVRQIWCQSAAVWIDTVPVLPGRQQD